MEMSDKNPIALPANMDLPASGHLYDQLTAALAEPELDKILIDGSNVERMSTAGLQIILAAVHNCKSQSKELILTNPSEKLSAAFELLGLKEELSKICAFS